MTVHNHIQPDVRKRTDEFERDFVATEGGDARATSTISAASAVTNDPSTNRPIISEPITNGAVNANVNSHLLALLEKSAQTLRHTAENIENRGLKLLLKVVAQERVIMYNTLREAMGKRVVDPLNPDRKPPARSVQQGLQDIQTSMTVQRQGRENVALTNLLKEEEALIAAYDAALDASVPPLWEILDSQRANVARLNMRFRSVDAGIDPIIARVFDMRVEGETALLRLREAGLDSSQIDAAPISQVAQPVLRTTRNPATAKSTMVAGALSGALVGGLVGLALAAFVWFYPQLVGWVTVGPWTLLMGAMIIGAVFGTVFGFFIGQNQREDDLMVTADGLINGEMLVVAYPKAHQVPMVEEILQVYHARELNR
jgi:hypothetical protein